MTSIVKQLLINQLDIPSDLFDKIKEFCFYDIKSWETMQFIRYKKKIIHDIFVNHTISRANPYDWLIDDKHWVVWINTPEDNIRCQFQGVNCTICGNYIQDYATSYIPIKILCNCTFSDDDSDYIDYDDYTDGTDW